MKMPLQVFARADSNAVPFLSREIRRRDFTEAILRKGRSLRWTSSFCERIALPSERRKYAAVALQQMHSKAIAITPLLLQAYPVETNPETQRQMLMALAAVCGERGLFPHGGPGLVKTYNITDWKAYEQRTLNAVKRMHPHLFPARLSERK